MKNNIIRFYTTKDRVRLMCAILEKIQNKTALELLEEYSIELKPPIDISTLLERIGISVIAKDFTKVEKKSGIPTGTILGAAISKEDDLAIFYKNTDTYNRKIFTIAHELGHCCKHAENLKISHIELRTDIEKFNEHEKEANIFAGELLIPEIVLRPYYDKLLVPSLDALSKIFCVSANVMAARLDYLGLDYIVDTDIDEV